MITAARGDDDGHNGDGGDRDSLRGVGGPTPLFILAKAAGGRG